MLSAAAASSLRRHPLLGGVLLRSRRTEANRLTILPVNRINPPLPLGGHRWFGGIRHFSSPKGSSSPNPNPNPNPDGYIYSEAQVRQLFENWCKEYSKEYPSEEIKDYRFGIFRDALESITRKNIETRRKKFVTSPSADLTKKNSKRSSSPTPDSYIYSEPEARQL